MAVDREYREALAKEIAAENALIGSRMGWNLTFQGFLFTGFALAVGKVSAHVLLVVLPCAGILAAISALIGLRAAFEQISVLEKSWDDHGGDLAKWGPKPFSDHRRDRRGRIPPYMMSLIIILAWVALLLNRLIWP
jgi:hypothetical protein